MFLLFKLFIIVYNLSFSHFKDFHDYKFGISFIFPSRDWWTDLD